MTRALSTIPLAGIAAGVFLSAGCHILPPLPNEVQDMGPRYKPSNIYRLADTLPPQIKRVAVLPMATPADNPNGYLRAGVDNLSSIVFAELEKCKRFEIIHVTRNDATIWTGKSAWRAEEALPADFFRKVADATACDAVLFVQLTRYSPYPPLAVGWKLTLAAIEPPLTPTQKTLKGKILWSADEVIDAGEPGVANAAKDYYARHLRNEAPSADPSLILNSPTWFGQYTLAALLETLPERAVTVTSAKVERPKGR